MTTDPYGVRRRPSYFAHPAAAVVASVIGTLFVGYYVHPWDTDARRSLVLGIVLGLPSIIIIKQILRRKVDYYAEFFITPVGERAQGRNFLYCLPVFGYIVCFYILQSVLGIRSNAGLGVQCCLSVLACPEQNVIYRTAWSRIEDMRQHVRTLTRASESDV